MRFFLPALLVGATMISVAPSSLRAADEHQYYEDRSHHDRHEWNEREERAWRHWLEQERHVKYHDWARANAREQQEYWRWRHEHERDDWR